MTNTQTTIPTTLFLALCEESLAYYTLVQDWLFEQKLAELNRVYDGCSDEL